MKIFDARYLNDLTKQSRDSPRLRQHRNIHQSYHDYSQRLFNAIDPRSYIRPHQHSTDPRDELLIAVRGNMAMVTFDDHGAINHILRFGTEKFGLEIAIGAEVSSSTWHTVIALEPNCILLEVKAGPFNPKHPKNFAPWAPEEGSDAANDYLSRLIERVSS